MSRQSLSAAIEAFQRHRLRTALSMTGVMLAVGVTLTTLSVNEGARRQALREAESLGLNTVIVRHPGRRLTLRDAERLPALVPIIATVSPAIVVPASIAGPVSTQQARLTGVLAAYGGIRRVAVTSGRFLRPADDTSGARVCVVASQLARRLFGYRQPLGETVRIGRDWYTIVGIIGDDNSSEVLVPLAALTSRRPTDDPSQQVDEIWIEVSDAAQAGPAITHALARHHADTAYEIIVARDLAAARDRTQQMFGVVAGISAALLFLLGGLATTNVMLTSVLERTPEIGLRRAVGATRRHIAAQFLLEAALISTLGALAGLLLGFMFTTLTETHAGWPAPLSGASVLSAVVVALVLGLASGAYPARKASGIQPIEALMHE